MMWDGDSPRRLPDQRLDQLVSWILPRPSPSLRSFSPLKAPEKASRITLLVVCYVAPIFYSAQAVVCGLIRWLRGRWCRRGGPQCGQPEATAALPSRRLAESVVRLGRGRARSIGRVPLLADSKKLL